MIRRTAWAVGSALITLWAIATGTFLLMEHAPGGPAGDERRLPPSVEAANLASLGLADMVRAPCDGRVDALPGQGVRVAKGTNIAGIRGETGDGCDVAPDRGGTILLVLAEPGEMMRAGQPILAIQPSAWSRYVRSMGAIARLDLGVTYTSRGERTVRENLADGLPVSIAVGALALLIAMCLGIPAGLLAAARRGTWSDRVLSAMATAGVSVPAIVLGPFLLYAFAIRGRIFRPGGLEGPADLILPAATLGLILAGVFQRMTRAGAAGFLEGPVAWSLRTRGIRESRILGVHGLRHAAIPMLGFLPPAIASLLTGSVVVETLFNLPGVARYLVGAALNRDHPMVMGVVLTYSVLLVTLTALAEILHPILDPRLRALGTTDERADLGSGTAGPGIAGPGTAGPGVAAEPGEAEPRNKELAGPGPSPNAPDAHQSEGSSRHDASGETVTPESDLPDRQVVDRGANGVHADKADCDDSPRRDGGAS
jgi:oligopeptide transport system permease protein